MTDERASSLTSTQPAVVPYQPRSAYTGFKAFGSGDGAVLVEPDVARDLRSAAELATQQGRVTGGLLYGRRRADDQGGYLVIDGFAAAGSSENRGQPPGPGDVSDFALSADDLRRLRQDAARRQAGRLELGWWRTRAALGEFGPRDFVTQGALVGPYGVGLLVYGSGVHWGTAYLGRDGHAPDSAGTLVTAPGAAAEPPPGPESPELAPPELVDIAAGEGLAEEPLPPPQAAPPAPPQPGWRRPGARRPAAGRSAVQAWAARKATETGSPMQTPADVQLVVGALAVVAVAIAIIVGVLVHSLLVTLIIAAVGLAAVFSSVWFQRR